MKDYVEQTIRALVDHPEALCITALDGEKSCVMELRCHESDIGKVIGKNGKTISALRTLLSTVAAKQGRRALLEVVE